MRARITLLAGMILSAAVLLAGCPKPNGYTGVRALAGIPPGELISLQPVPGDPAHALLVLKGGEIQRVDLTQPAAAPTEFLDISQRLVPSPADEEGLLGLAFAPDFTTSHKFYVYYTTDNPLHNRLSRFTAQGDHADPASEHVMLNLPPKRFSNHNGGALAFGPDGYLYIGVGDGGGGGDPDGNGQNTNSLFGKILRIDVSGDGYTIPPDNPFAHGGGAPEVYAYGLRNPWRLSFDSKTGQLWAGDVGQNLWEEVDRIVPGGNYGWNVMEGNHCYQPSSGCNTTGLIPPRTEYGHDVGCAIIGGSVYRGHDMPEMDGWYVFGDYCSGRVWAVNAETETGDAVPLASTGATISSFAQGADGELYILTFDQGVLKLVRKPA